MNIEAASVRLESLRHSLTAARDCNHGIDNPYVNGLTAGLRIAVEAIEKELQFARDLEAALAGVRANHTQ